MTRGVQNLKFEIRISIPDTGDMFVGFIFNFGFVMFQPVVSLDLGKRSSLFFLYW